MKVWMFVYNDCRHDARVMKEAQTLAQNGHSVKIVALHEPPTEACEDRDGYRIVRLKKLFLSITAKPSGQPSSQPAAQRAPSRPGFPARALRRLYGWIDRNIHGGPRKMINTLYRPWAFWHFYRLSLKLVSREPAEVYHCHDLNTLMIGYLARKRHGGRLIYDAHELTTELTYLAASEKQVWKRLESFLIKRVDAVIVPSRYRGEFLSQRYGISPPEVVMNCPPTSRKTHSRETLRARLGLSSQPIVLYTGGYNTGRCLKNLVRSAAYLKEAVMVLVGWGILEGDLRATVSRYGLEKKVLFLDPVPPDELVDYITSATLGVVIYQNNSLNNYYAAPNKLYEYIHAGLPVVSSDFPSLKEVVEGFGLGATFDPEDPRSIAAAANAVLADRQRYAIMRANALKAAQIFNWENESARLLGIYRRLSRNSDDKTA